MPAEVVDRVIRMLTTAGATRFTIGDRLGSGSPSTAAGSCAHTCADSASNAAAKMVRMVVPEYIEIFILDSRPWNVTDPH